MINTFYKHNQYAGTSTIERSKYMTMENLVEILDEYYRVIEQIHELYTKEFCKIESTYLQYRETIKKDTLAIKTGRKNISDILETKQKIQNKLGHFVRIYFELDTKLKGLARFFNDQEDKIDYQQKNEKFLILFDKIYGNIEDILEQYNQLIEEQGYEDDK